MTHEASPKGTSRGSANESFTDVGRMPDQCELDAVIAVTGPADHSDLAHGRYRTGTPRVFIEKPLALNHAAAQALASAADRAGLAVTVGMMKRHAPIYKRLKAIVDQDSFGPSPMLQQSFESAGRVALDSPYYSTQGFTSSTCCDSS